MPHSSYARKVIRHPLFQRLKHIQQLGTIDRCRGRKGYSRYTHSIGTSSLARLVGSVLSEKKHIDKKWTVVLELAGLLHDIGHGCFSHSLDHYLEKEGIFSTHEERSQTLVKIIALDNHWPIWITKSVIYLINPVAVPKPKDLPLSIRFVINNPHRGEQYKASVLDVDRLDYIVRDSNIFNVDSLVTSAQIKRFLSHSYINSITGLWDFGDAHVNQRIWDLRHYLHTTCYPATDLIESEKSLFEELKQKEKYWGYYKFLQLRTRGDVKMFEKFIDKNL